MLVNANTADQLAFLLRTWLFTPGIMHLIELLFAWHPCSPLQERLHLTTKDADFSAVWLTRDQFGMTFLG